MMIPPDANPAREARLKEYMRQWLDEIGTPSMAMLPTPNSVPVIQRIEDVVARATRGMELHADRVRDAHARAAAWRSEAVRATEAATGPAAESRPNTRPRTLAGGNPLASGPGRPGRFDRLG